MKSYVEEVKNDLQEIAGRLCNQRVTVEERREMAAELLSIQKRIKDRATVSVAGILARRYA